MTEPRLPQRFDCAPERYIFTIETSALALAECSFTKTAEGSAPIILKTAVHPRQPAAGPNVYAAAGCIAQSPVGRSAEQLRGTMKLGFPPCSGVPNCRV